MKAYTQTNLINSNINLIDFDQEIKTYLKDWTENYWVNNPNDEIIVSCHYTALDDLLSIVEKIQLSMRNNNEGLEQLYATIEQLEREVLAGKRRRFYASEIKRYLQQFF